MKYTHKEVLNADETIDWRENIQSSSKVNIEFIKFSKMKSWYLSNSKDKIYHSSKKFFRIEGLEIKSKDESKFYHNQPIINQDETGILGFIAKKIGKQIFVLVQAKIEPGNLNLVQISPTVQATQSNYKRIHQGKNTKYLNYFNSKNKKVIFDQLQSEHGSRFYKKRNRNIIIQLNNKIKVYKNFKWISLNDLSKLNSLNNFLNMDCRTVLSSLLYFGRYDQVKIKLSRFREIAAWLAYQKNQINFISSIIPLNKIKGWRISDKSIYSLGKKVFEIKAIRAQISSREISEWDQPIIVPKNMSTNALICKKIYNKYYFLVKTVFEFGNFDKIEIGPTIQSTDIDNKLNSDQKFYLDYIMNAKPKQIFHDSLQSEEGGRFYHEQHRNLIIFADKKISTNIPNNYFWLTLKEIAYLNTINNFFNVQFRTLISNIVSKEMYFD